MSKSDTFTYMLTNWAAWWCSGHCFVTAERSWFLIQAGASPLLHRFSLSAPASSFSPKVCWEVTGGSKLVIGVKVGLKGISGKKVDKFCFTSTCKTQMFKDSVLSYHTISCILSWNIWVLQVDVKQNVIPAGQMCRVDADAWSKHWCNATSCLCVVWGLRKISDCHTVCMKGR